MDQQDQNCMFCEQPSDLTDMMREALLGKHAKSQAESNIGYINVLLDQQQPCSGWQAWAYIQFKQYKIVDQTQQFLKRQYKHEQYDGKIKMLSQYYKFHADVPRVVEPSVQRIINKYYDKKREYDYRRIKKILREEQGLSITSIQNQSSENQDEEIQKKSRYSTLLDDLDNTNLDNMMSDSKLLKQMCRTIQKALPKTLNDRKFSIKGTFQAQSSDFQRYLKKKQQKPKQLLSSHNYTKPINLKQLLARREKNKKNERQNTSKQTIQRQFKDNKLRQTKRKQKQPSKQGKFITNIKIQIKNAMFYSEQPSQPNRLNQFQLTKKQDLFKKKNFINQINLLSQPNISSKKLIAEVYRSTQNQDLFKKKINSTSLSKNRIQTKQSNKSQIKQKQVLKKYNGSHSARKLNNIPVDTGQIKGPVRSNSSASIRKRSGSLNSGSVANLKIINGQNKCDRVGSLSKYGSEQKKILIKQIINRKLICKKQ